MRKPKRILAVDDSRRNLAILRIILGEEYNLATASDGRTALQLAKSFKPQIVLLDVMMPLMDGLETCRRIRLIRETESAYIVMLSAKAMPSEQAEGYDAGADEYLTKPFDEVELIELVRDFFGERPMQESTSSTEPNDLGDNGFDEITF